MTSDLKQDSDNNWKWIGKLSTALTVISGPIIAYFITVGVPAHPLAIPWLLTIFLPLLAFVWLLFVSHIIQHNDIKWLESKSSRLLTRRIKIARDLMTSRTSISFAFSVTFGNLEKPEEISDDKWKKIRPTRISSAIFVFFMIQSIFLILFIGLLYGFVPSLAHFHLIIWFTIFEFVFAIFFVYFFAKSRRIWVNEKVLSNGI